jgi:hypothetical protein
VGEELRLGLVGNGPVVSTAVGDGLAGVGGGGGGSSPPVATTMPTAAAARTTAARMIETSTTGERRRGPGGGGPNRRHQLTARGESLVPLLGHAPGHHVVHGRGEARSSFGGPGWRLSEVCPQHRRVLVGLEGRRAGERLEQDAAQGVHVGPSVDVFSLDLFRGHVLDRPHELTGGREAGVGFGPLAQRTRGAVSPGPRPPGGCCPASRRGGPALWRERHRARRRPVR